MKKFLIQLRVFLITLSGARPEILRHCPTERGKFEGIGGAVLTTSVLAVVSMTFALSSALGVPLVLAVPASLAWGLAIMSLDRWLVGTIQADGPRRWPLAIPRIMMAMLLGLVISTPLVLQIFKSEIDAQIVQIKQERADAFTTRQEKGAVGQEVERFRRNVADLNKVISSDGDVPLDPAKDTKIIALNAERDAQQEQANEHYDEWQCQLYGKANGRTCARRGDGVLAQTSRSAYNRAKSRVDALNRQIEERKKQLTATDKNAKKIRLATAQAELPRAQSQLNAALRRQSDLQTAFDAENRATNGLLIRLQALNEVSDQDLTLRSAHILLFLVFLLIECLPVTVKLMQKPGNYEKVLSLAARKEFRDAKESFVPRQRAGANGTAALQDIWALDATPATPGSAPPPQPPQPPPPDDGPGQTHEPAHEPGHEEESWEDMALREMPDAQVVRTAEPTGPAGERPGGFELFPDDD